MSTNHQDSTNTLWYMFSSPIDDQLKNKSFSGELWAPQRPYQVLHSLVVDLRPPSLPWKKVCRKLWSIKRMIWMFLIRMSVYAHYLFPKKKVELTHVMASSYQGLFQYRNKDQVWDFQMLPASNQKWRCLVSQDRATTTITEKIAKLPEFPWPLRARVGPPVPQQVCAQAEKGHLQSSNQCGWKVAGPLLPIKLSLHILGQ